jgi:hypothetical protein
MLALFRNLALLHHVNAVRIADGGESMGDRHRSPIYCKNRQRLLEGSLNSLMKDDLKEMFGLEIAFPLLSAKAIFQAVASIG